MSTDNKKPEDEDIVALELEGEGEVSVPKTSPQTRGPLEEQRKGINTLFDRADRVHAIIKTPQYRTVLAESGYDDQEEGEFFDAFSLAKEKDFAYIQTLKKRKKMITARTRAIEHAEDHIRKAKRRGRPVITKQPHAKEEFCVGVQLNRSVESIRYQGPLVLAAVKDYFDKLPRYSKQMLADFEASLKKMEDAVIARNRAEIHVRLAKKDRDDALEELRNEIADFRIAAEIAAETEEDILATF